MNENQNPGTPENQQPQQGHPQGNYQGPYQYPPYGQQYTGPQDGYPPPPYGYQPPYPTHGDSTKLYSVLSYIWILWMIGLFADKNNPRVKFHVNQGIILTIFQVALCLASAIFSTVMNALFIHGSALLSVAAPIGTMLSGLVSFLAISLGLIFMILGIIHAVQGKEEPLPIIGKLFTIVK